jgi:D-glycero-alpha-D-manno-heptose-7-phosphate kinase
MSTEPRIIIKSKAPTRIDLAGGTVDIWPLYLFLKRPVTINLAINLFAEARLELSYESAQPGILLRSEDQNIERLLRWEDLNDLSLTQEPIPPQLELHSKLLRFFAQKRQSSGWQDYDCQLSLTTRAQSPAGAGLGGSSTLSIAMIGALATWASAEKAAKPIDTQQSGDAFIEIVRDVETTVIQVPAGLQDYYGAMYGGLQALRWGPGQQKREWLNPQIIPDLQDRILLFYSGQSRNSGINNWALFKGFIDRNQEIRSQFQKISDATQKLEKALRHSDWIGVGAAIDEEWQVRKTLAAGITTPDIDHAFEKARKISPVSGKVCGAGGGGCFFIYLPTPASQPEGLQLGKQIEATFESHGMRRLKFEGVPHGLQVQVQHERV